MKIYIKVLITLCVGFMFTSCELGLQDTYDFKTSAVTVEPYAEMTAWEFIQTQTGLDEDGELSFEQLHYMIAAIEKAGMEDLYNQTSTTDRTYLILNNAAFTGGKSVIRTVTGLSSADLLVARETETPEQIFERVDTPEKMEKLKTILSYHIVDAYVAQVPTLAVDETAYIFQTLIPGPDGEISFKRDFDWDVEINSRISPLPRTAFQGGWNERVRSHNYVFNNGLGHILNEPVRNKPY